MSEDIYASNNNNNYNIQCAMRLLWCVDGGLLGCDAMNDMSRYGTVRPADRSADE